MADNNKKLPKLALKVLLLFFFLIFQLCFPYYTASKYAYLKSTDRKRKRKKKVKNFIVQNCEHPKILLEHCQPLSMSPSSWSLSTPSTLSLQQKSMYLSVTEIDPNEWVKEGTNDWVNERMNKWLDKRMNEERKGERKKKWTNFCATF